MWLAWRALRSEGPVWAPRRLAHDSTARLYGMGLLTNLLNPKIAVLYLSLLPQFVDPSAGHVFRQSMALGLTQILVSLSVNAAIIWCAGGFAVWMGHRPSWAAFQKWLMATVLGALAVRLALERRPS